MINSQVISIKMSSPEDIPDSQDWVVDREYFGSIGEDVFMEEVRQYPAIYESNTNQQFKRSNIKSLRESAWRNLAQIFRAKIQWCETRYRTIRTRVGRYLREVRLSGNGFDDFDVHPEFKNLKWIFSYIKNRPNDRLTGTQRVVVPQRPIHFSPTPPMSSEAIASRSLSYQSSSMDDHDDSEEEEMMMSQSDKNLAQSGSSQGQAHRHPNMGRILCSTSYDLHLVFQLTTVRYKLFHAN